MSKYHNGLSAKLRLCHDGKTRRIKCDVDSSIRSLARRVAAEEGQVAEVRKSSDGVYKVTFYDLD